MFKLLAKTAPLSIQTLRKPRTFSPWLFISLLVVLVAPNNAVAAEEFYTDTNSVYSVQESGITMVTNDVTLENKFSTVYATAYSLSLSGTNPKNVKALENGKELQLSTQTQEDRTDITVNFENALVGKGKSRNFEIKYEVDSVAVRTGEVWEISIPRLLSPENYRDFQLTLEVPVAFGQLAYTSPDPISRQEDISVKRYVFSKDSLSRTGVTAAFGNFQVFSFDLTYHLENPLKKQAFIDVAIPPDTAYQRVYYRTIDPKPETVTTDSDGNWLARFKLAPRQVIEAKVGGEVQIFAFPRQFPTSSKETLFRNTQESKYWQVNDPKIKALAGRLRTPKEIYDYVVSTLSYDYNRVTPNVDRIGAVGALQAPDQAICMEFTDLFIAIARAAGIPAREVNGYAYTENPEIEPLSLVADVLHAWPEYWDSARNVWVPVDPTWGSTTGGVDFFSKLDLRHFTFVNHGVDSEIPYPPGSYKLGANPQKDVFVNFGKLYEPRSSIPQTEVNISSYLLYRVPMVTVSIYNPGPVMLHDLPVQILFDNTQASIQSISIPPFATEKLSVKVPVGVFGISTPANITVILDGEQTTVPSPKSAIVVIHTLILVSLSGVFLFIFLYRWGKLKVPLPITVIKKSR